MCVCVFLGAASGGCGVENSSKCRSLPVFKAGTEEGRAGQGVCSPEAGERELGLLFPSLTCMYVVYPLSTVSAV